MSTSGLYLKIRILLRCGALDGDIRAGWYPTSPTLNIFSKNDIIMSAARVTAAGILCCMKIYKIILTVATRQAEMDALFRGGNGKHTYIFRTE